MLDIVESGQDHSFLFTADLTGTIGFTYNGSFPLTAIKLKDVFPGVIGSRSQIVSMRSTPNLDRLYVMTAQES